MQSIVALAASAAPLSDAADFFGPKAWLYLGFIVLVLIFLALDLGVFHRHAHVVSMREAATWTVVWIAAALLFNVAIFFIYEHQWLGMGASVAQLDGTERAVGGWEAAKLFLTGYVVEKSLSMDNVFVIAMIFGYFAIPAAYQHRVLFWGILTALVLRGVMIAVGAALIQNFTWIVYVFGAFLILTAIKMAVVKHDNVDPEKNPIIKLIRRLMPVTSEFDGQRFFTRNSSQYPGVLAATPLLLALVMVETVDLVFAVDSIPAIFAITADPFIVFTSNVFAILGLRALYFCLAAMIDMFKYLKISLIVILAFVGVKMLLIHTEYKIDTTASLVVVLGLLAAGVVASLLRGSAGSRPKAGAEA